MNEQEKQFILSHLNDDVRKLALSKTPDSVNLRFVLEQIDGRQRAKTKLPSLAANPDIIFPVHLSVEQCSSEATAAYKAQVLTPSNSPTGGGQNPAEGSSSPVGRSGGVLIDLTGGFGIDFIALSKLFGKAIYVERNAELCAIAEQNFHTLNLTNTQIINSEAEDFLDSTSQLPPYQGGLGWVFFADPARRSESGSRTYAISDCTPNILQLIPVLKKHVATSPSLTGRAGVGLLFLKLSPMLDWHKAVEDIQAQGVNVSEVHIVSVKNECKELLLLVELQSAPQPAFRLFCVDLPLTPSLQDGEQLVTSLEIPYPITLSSPRPERLLSPDKRGSQKGVGLGEGQNGVGEGLLLPNASIMKAGCWDFLISRFGVTQADPNSHIFFSDHEIADFPGKQYRIQAVCTMNKKELRSALQGITHANIAVRNFPLSADALRKRLKLKDGGDTYIFGTTIQGEHKLIVATPPNLPTKEE
ncbi:MAG: class I SAM-dependent methyltransferase [Bacteroidaceae bacterium]|nr:class I SAM-dependent methyltransferase [Bacteroidaceae bacterium]